MTMIENITTLFPDKFGIKDCLRNLKVQNSEFLPLVLKSYELWSEFRDQKLLIANSLKSNENVNIFDHQILAAQKIKNELGGTAMLADEVGLGKTVEAGIIIKEFLATGLATKILILVPPALRAQWKDEMSSKFSLDFVSQEDPTFEDIVRHDLLIMSHASAVFPKQMLPLKAKTWDLVIVDEAHSMKNSNTHKHKLVKNLPKRNILLLTATPIQNNLEDLYNLVEILRPGHLGTWSKFKDRYALGNSGRMINPVFKDELQQILSRLIIRTTRDEARKYIKFTDRIPHTSILRPTDDEISLYDAITEIIRNIYSRSSSNDNILALMIYQRLASSSTHASKRALYKMMMNQFITEDVYQEYMAYANRIKTDSKMINLEKLIKDGTGKFLIFTEFYATQDYITINLKNKGHSVTMFNGKMTSEEKRESVRRFKNDVQIMVSTSAGGEGQNFQFCHNIVNYDLPWNPMKVEQRIGRVHRIGQEYDVQIYNFALEGTIEAYILELLYTKIQLFQMALGHMDLLFEDSWGGGSSQTWFKEYITSKDKKDMKNRFTALGNNWKNRKEQISNAINDFNEDVFTNFDLSIMNGGKNEPQ